MSIWNTRYSGLKKNHTFYCIFIFTNASGFGS
jgi:hypothetical protein